jgi:hypothetical protein
MTAARPSQRGGKSMKSVLAICIVALWPAIGAGAQEASIPPKVSEIMTRQQTRHIKLWFAGRAGNWRLADYEIDALGDGFDDLSQQFGGDTVEKAVGAPISALEKAIDAKDRDAFVSAFDKLTAGCNSCHRSLNHGYIVIQRPTSSPYSDQFFATQK